MQTRNTVGYFRLLQQNPSFRNLWYGQVVSELGDWLNSIAIYALILKLSDSGMAMAGAMMAVKVNMGPKGAQWIKWLTLVMVAAILLRLILY